MAGAVDPQEYFGATDSVLWHNIEIVESDGASLAARLAEEGSEVGETIAEAIGVLA